MKKIFIISAICLFAVGALSAQSKTSLTYSFGFTTGDLHDYIGKVSFRGITFDYRKMVNPNIGVGFTLGWNVFYEAKAYGTYTFENTSLTGKHYRYSNHFPMIAAATYYLKPEDDINPFFGMGVGTIYTLRNTDVNLYTFEQDAWNFALVPEAGIIYRAGDAASITVSAKYNQGFKAGNELSTSQSFVSLNVGFAFIK